ncbi:MAG: hypothetical protein KC933_13545 [Myxococcales bacterium]|nr:hypothetical protein [Myxococcales bacterium]MCB9645667.1 hypothetical protein [Deltaproteobacteria bacterium]
MRMTKHVLMAAATLLVAATAAAQPPARRVKPKLDVDPELKASFERLQSQAQRPARWQAADDLVPGATLRVKAVLQRHDDGMVLLGTAVTPAQQAVLLAQGAHEVETKAAIGANTIHDGWYYRLYPTRDVSSVGLDARVGKTVRVDMARTRSGHPVVVAVSGG